MKILIVDDNPLNCELLTMIAEDCGHSYQCVENGQLAVNAIKKDTDIDLVLMDVSMPVMDGLEATRQIKQQFSERLITVVFVTALDEEDIIARCLAIGGDDFIPKPINEAILTAKLKAHERTIEFCRELNNSHRELAYHRRLVEREHNIIENIFKRCTDRMEKHCDNIDYYMSPMSQFNGDVFLVERSPLGGVYILMGDFTGHGLAAAIGCLPVSDVFFAMSRKKTGVGKIAREMNAKVGEILPDNMFFCATLLELDAQGGRLTIWSGGMSDILLLDANHCYSDRIQAQHMPLGVLDDEEFDEAVAVVTPFNGQRAYVYTDGVVEAKNPDGEFYGESRLLKVLQANSSRAIPALTGALRVFTDGRRQSDDIGIAAITGGPVTFSGLKQAKPEMNLSDFQNSGPLPWHIQVKLTPKELKNPTTLRQVLRLVCSIDQADQHESILFTLLNELYNNALEHGLLQLESRIKEQKDGFEHYYQMRMKRLAELRQGEILLEIKVPPQDTGQLYLSLTDSGTGFNYQNIQVPLEQNDVAYAQGINLVQSLCEQLHYSNSGRTVQIVYRLN